MIRINASQKKKLAAVSSAFRSDGAAVFSAVFLAIIIIISLFAPLFPLDPDKTDIANMLASPSLQHWFGTDDLGRDYFARIVYGGRISLLVGVLAMLMSVFLGVLAGTVSGYFGGVVDEVLMRIVDVIQSIPWLVLVTVVTIFFKKGLGSIIVVIGFFSWMEIARLVRAEILSAKEREFVLYAEFSGVPRGRIIFEHLIPAVFPTIITAATTNIANAVMTESALSFLGIGIQEPLSSWGKLLQNAQSNLQGAVYMALIPGLLIMCTIFAFNKAGNLLRMYADPRIMEGGV